MIHHLLDELRASIRRPQFVVVAALIVIVPPVSGVASLSGYALDHWMSYATIMFDGLGLLFPLLVTLLTQPRLLDEWSNTYANSVRTRVAPAQYFRTKVASSAILAGAVFLTATALSLLVARLTYTDHGYGVASAGPIETRFPLSQLWALSPALYVIALCLWVGLVAASVGIWCTLLTALVSNRFVALVAPLVLWTAVQFGLAVIGLEELSLPPFRFHLIQQPIWTEFVGLIAITVASAAMLYIVRKSDYQSPGIVRP